MGIKTAEMPESYIGEGYQLTSLEKILGIAKSNSIWPLPFATSCCGIEFMATMGSHYDLARFGSERVGFSPRQCDLLMVMGTIAKKMGPVVKQVYLQMAEPRWVMAVGVIAALCLPTSRASRRLSISRTKPARAARVCCTGSARISPSGSTSCRRSSGFW